MSDFGVQLIREVYKYPLLYDNTLKDYRDFHKKESLWEQIGDLLESTGFECRQKWRNLRDTYIRYRRENGKMNGGYVRWRYYDLMSFIDPDLPVPEQRHFNECVSKYAKTRKQKDLVQWNNNNNNLGNSKTIVKRELQEEQESEEEVTSMNEAAYPADNLFLPPGSLDLTQLESADGSDSTISFTNSKKRARVDAGERYEYVNDDEALRPLYQIHAVPPQQIHPPTFDLGEEAQVMAASYVPCLRRLPPKQRMLVDLQIKKILFDAEYPSDRETMTVIIPQGQ